MIDLPFTALTEQQRARIAWLFADKAFGTDPAAFIYEQDEAGEINSRRRITPAAKCSPHPVKDISIISATDPCADSFPRNAWLKQIALSAVQHVQYQEITQ